ncbi:GAF domain-containing protein [Synechococcus sp. RSCCF101]|uniref:GAF domain-containing protein n=1 Tax=Synechococcus sp. RSCCF101 TaxID=2511069 RepID=UPI00351A670B
MKRVLDVPIAAISLIDQRRQWCLELQGADFVEIPRHDSFCQHTIQQGSTLVIPDARADARVAGSPLVSGDAGIRFYAGHPLTLCPDIRLGALCVFDTKPRSMGEEDIQFLADLAETVVNELKASMLINIMAQR